MFVDILFLKIEVYEFRAGNYCGSILEMYDEFI